MAEASRRHYDHIGFDYLSRLEAGKLMPSVPKLTTLALIYDRPVSELVDLYETETLRKLVPKGKSYEMLRELAMKALGKGEITKALALFLGALDSAKQGNDRRKIAVGYNNTGGVLIRAGRYRTAKHFIEEGLRYAENPHTMARLLDNLAQVHYQLDTLPVADILSREALALASGDDALKPITRATRASILLEMKRYAEAEQLLREAVDEYRKTGTEASEIRQTYNLGHCLVEQGKIDEGLSHLRTAAARASERGDPDLRAKSSYFYGRCLFKVGRKEDAGAPLRSALKLASEHELPNEVFHAAYYLWLLMQEIGAEEDAAKYLEIAQRSRARLQQRSEEAVAFSLITRERKPGRRISTPA